MRGRVVVLGGCGAWPEPGRACSGFLLEHDGFKVALDLGYATLPRLLALLGSATAVGLDAVVVTHDHPDHVVDLHGLFRALLYGGRQDSPISLYAPEAVLERIAGLEDSDRSVPEQVFAWQPLPAGAYEVGPFRLESWVLPHYVALEPETPHKGSACGVSLAGDGHRLGQECCSVTISGGASLWEDECSKLRGWCADEELSEVGVLPLWLAA